MKINDNQNERAGYLQDATCCSGSGWGRVKQLDTSFGIAF
jgi:hypothetical protein